MNYTNTDYRKRIANVKYANSVVKSCLRRMHIHDYIPGQVIYNLINNAISFTGEGKKVTVRQHVTESQVRIDVVDYGIGIPPEEMDGIWERYYSKKTPHRRAVIGTGLGLSIVKEILKLHGAAFGVESEQEKGSDFWFILPLDEEEAL